MFEFFPSGCAMGCAPGHISPRLRRFCDGDGTYVLSFDSAGLPAGGSPGPLRRRRLSRKARARRSWRSSRAVLAGSFDLFFVMYPTAPYPACPGTASCGSLPDRCNSGKPHHQFRGIQGPHSSGVEHSLGKGEVESSNLSVGTILFQQFAKCGRMMRRAQFPGTAGVLRWDMEFLGQILSKFGTMILGPPARGSVSDEGSGWDRALGPLLILSFCALGLGLFLPVLRVDKFFVFTEQFSIMDSIMTLFMEGEIFIALVVLLFSIAFPLVKLAQAFSLWRRTDIHSGHFDRRLKWLGFLSKWSMVDVFVVALVVFSVKASAIANATTEPGLYFFFAASIGTAAAIGLIKAAAERLRNGEETVN